MHALTGYLDFRPEERGETAVTRIETTAQSRQDNGCVDNWWVEDLVHCGRFHFFECWESEEAFDAHQAQPYEIAFMADHISRIVGAQADVLAAGERSAVAGT